MAAPKKGEAYKVIQLAPTSPAESDTELRARIARAWRAPSRHYATRPEAQQAADAAKRRRPKDMVFVAAAGKTNPTKAELAEAAALSEQFHGRPAKSATVIEEEDKHAGALADLGRLVSLTVILADGRPAELEFSRAVHLAANGAAGQLYFLGGDQRINLAALGIDAPGKDVVTVGEAAGVVYHTSKAFHDFEPIDYTHEFGEESGVRPTLLYDTINGRLSLSGGNYQVRPEGITD